MGQLIYMSRFREPDHTDDPVVKGTCKGCSIDLHQGQDVVAINGAIYCDYDCLIDDAEVKEL